MAEPRSGDDLAQVLMEKAAGDEKMLDEAELPRPEHADDLPNLSPWAGEFRYARVADAVPGRQEMRTLVEQTRAWAEAQLPASEPSG